MGFQIGQVDSSTGRTLVLYIQYMYIIILVDLNSVCGFELDEL